MQNILYTIGHSNHPAEGFIDLLKQHAVAVVCDVRSQPYSRHNPQFNRETLREQLAANNIEYVYLGAELGARSSEPACRKDGRVRFDLLARTELFLAGVRRIKMLMESGRTALMCAEKDPLNCHRTMLICRNIRDEMPIEHILADGSVETNGQMEERLLRLVNIPQDDLFMDRRQMVDRAYDLLSGKIMTGSEEKGTKKM